MTLRQYARCAVVLLAFFSGVGTGLAHDPGLSSAHGVLRADVLELTTGFAPADAQELLPVWRAMPESWDESDFEAVQDQLVALAPGLWAVEVAGERLPIRELRVELLPDDNVSFFLAYPRPAEGEMLRLHAAKLAQLPSAHRQFAMITDEHGSLIARKLLSARDATLDVPLAGLAVAASVDPTMLEFLLLGIEHIWTGYDHLLFLFALLVVCRTFRSIIAIITCFTVAHSLTLALATFDLVNLPGRIVEPIIAASIVYVGAENLWRRGEEPRGRWVLTFVFGLIHGFGFATVLRDLGIGGGGGGVAMPLVTFNLGVEIGQIVIAAIVLPIVWHLRKHPGFVQRGVPVLSGLIASAGLVWLVHRTVFA
jgi:hydrogenase/urease accessory protein HupE